MKKIPQMRSLYRDSNKAFAHLNINLGIEKGNLLKQKKLLRETRNYLIKASQETMINFYLKNIIESLKIIISLEDELSYYRQELRLLYILIK